jgi:hypothetical protein
MIVGSPGETLRTLEETLAFIERTRPGQVIFNPWTLLPGTRDFADAERAGMASAAMFFTDDFFELTFDRWGCETPEKQRVASWLLRNQGLRQTAAYSVEELSRILEQFPGLAAAHLDLAAACCRAGEFARAERHARQARDLGYPRPMLVHNCLACIAAARGDMREALTQLLAARAAGHSRVVEDNLAAARRWAVSGAARCGRPLELRADTAFEVSRPLQQPVTPGPLSISGRVFHPVQSR